MANTYQHCTADTAVVGKQVVLDSVCIAPLTAAPTAGLLTIYDNTAESGDVVYKEWVFATAPGHCIDLDVVCRKGIYVSFDATLANVGVTVAYS